MDERGGHPLRDQPARSRCTILFIIEQVSTLIIDWREAAGKVTAVRQALGNQSTAELEEGAAQRPPLNTPEEASDPPAKSMGKLSARWLAMVHYPVMILQGCLFYAACNSFFGSENGTIPLLTRVASAIHIQSALLILNACWLLRLIIARYELEEDRGTKKAVGAVKPECRLCGLAFELCGWFGTTPSEQRIVVALSTLILNSLLNFSFAADAYVPQS